MEYNDLYDESPYTTKHTPRRGDKMMIIRATFLACATILASVFSLLFYNYQQDQFVISSNGIFTSIFDRKSKTINLCDKSNCNLVTPIFETRPLMSQNLTPQNAAPQPITPGGMPQGLRSPQMMPSPGMNPQQGMTPPVMGQQMGGGQMIHPQMNQPQMMRPQMPPPMHNPQMMPHAQMTGAHMMAPQMINSPHQALQPQLTGGPTPQATQTPPEEASENTGEEEAAANEEAPAEGQEENAGGEEAAAGEEAPAEEEEAPSDAAASEEPTEEAAPV